MGRTKNVVGRFLKDPLGYDDIKRKGRTPKLEKKLKTRIRRAARLGDKSSSDLMREFDLPISSRRVRQILNEDPNMTYTKARAAPPLSVKHKQNRVEWARTMLIYINFFNVIFSDEKKFNLDGPDGTKYYWHDIRNEKKLLSRRQNGGTSVMVWAGFSVHGTTHLAFLEGKQKSSNYTKTLESYLLPFASDVMKNEYFFQQDNAPIHVSEHSKDWMRLNGVPLLPWPARSPDLNPIENVWGILARRVYAHGKQYYTKMDLIEAIKREWANIPKETLENLVASMPNRCASVLEAKGATLKY
jgi:transposase